MTDRMLRITADDFGMDPLVNAAITELARTGAIQAASLLTTAAHAEDALAANLPIAVGLHVDLPSAVLATATADQVVDLIEAQYEWMSVRGHSPTHLDLHTAALYGIGPQVPRPGGVVGEALTVAARHNLAFRLPRRLPDDVAAAGAHRVLVDRAERFGVALPEAILTDFRPGQQVPSDTDLREHYRALVRQLPPGRSEIFLHPALAGLSTGLSSADPQRRKRLWEYRLLASGRLHRDLTEAGVALVAGRH